MEDEPIKENLIFRQKDLDKYLVETKELLLKEKQLKGEMSFLKKNLAATQKFLHEKHKWLMKRDL